MREPPWNDAGSGLTATQLHRWARQVLADSQELRLVTAQLVRADGRVTADARPAVFEKQCRLMERRARASDRRARRRRGDS